MCKCKCCEEAQKVIQALEEIRQAIRLLEIRLSIDPADVVLEGIRAKTSTGTAILSEVYKGR